MVASPSTEAAGPSGSDNLVQDSHSMDGIVDGPGVVSKNRFQNLDQQRRGWVYAMAWHMAWEI